MLTLRGMVGIGLLLAVLSLAGWLYWKGGHDKAQHIENKTLKTEAKEVAKSIKTSQETQRRVDVQGADTRDHTQQAQGAIRDRIQADPRPAGHADPIVLRVAQEAHERAIRAACRVQRTSDCPAPAAAP